MEENSQKKSIGVIQHLSSLTALQIADDDKVKNKFIAMYEAIHGGKGLAFYEAERHYFIKLIAENKDLQNCSRLSLYGAFIDCAVNGLSFDPQRKLGYLLWDNHNLGTRENPQWEKRARYAISPYGELYLRQTYGQIKTADNPEVVYEGEEFMKISSKDGTIIEHKIKYPRPNTKLIGAYVRIVKADGSVDYFVMDMNQMARLKEYSANKNGGYASKLYGTKDKDIDAGFLIAKTIKHAFKSYPKVKLKGQYTVLETDLEPDPTDAVTYDDIEPQPVQEQPSTEQPVQEEPSTEQPSTEQPVQEQQKERKLNF